MIVLEEPEFVMNLFEGPEVVSIINPAIQQLVVLWEPELVMNLFESPEVVSINSIFRRYYLSFGNLDW